MTFVGALVNSGRIDSSARCWGDSQGWVGHGGAGQRPGELADQTRKAGCEDCDETRAEAAMGQGTGLGS